MISTKRLAQYECLIRRIRRHPALFGDEGDEREVRLGIVLKKAKARCEQNWNTSAHERRNATFEKQYAIDTAIYYGGKI